MSNLGLIIEERSRDIGDFLVGRLLPFRKKRMVGPFIFFDHMGPKDFGPDERMDIGPHPHIGLSTLTYLLEGRLVHRDSLGTEQEITPGAVNWMTAGSGIVHSERSPKNHSDINRMHGMQIWVALPLEHEDVEPSFHHIEAKDLPAWETDGVSYKLVAGEAYGEKSPVPVYSKLFMVDIKTKESRALNTDKNLKGEIGLYVLEGAIDACGERVEKGHLLVAKEDDNCRFQLTENSHVILFGGEPFAEKREIYWNFVASTKERIEAAKDRWRDRQFPEMPNDSGYIPLPGEK